MCLLVKEELIDFFVTILRVLNWAPDSGEAVFVSAVGGDDARNHDNDVGGKKGGEAANAVGEDTKGKVAHGTAQEEHDLGKWRDPVIITYPIIISDSRLEEAHGVVLVAIRAVHQVALLGIHLALPYSL